MRLRYAIPLAFVVIAVISGSLYAVSLPLQGSQSTLFLWGAVIAAAVALLSGFKDILELIERLTGRGSRPESSREEPPPPAPAATTVMVESGGAAVGEGNIVLGAGAQYAPGGRINTGTIIKKQVVLAGPAEDLATATQHYLQRLVRDCNELDSLHALSFDVEDTTQITLEQVYIALDTTTRAPLTPDEKEQAGRSGRERDDRPLSALEATAQHKQVVLLGDPGSGKSSFVRYLTLRLAAAALDEKAHQPPAGWPPLIPVLVVLRDLGPRLAAVDLQDRAFKTQQKLLREAVWAQWREACAELGAPAFGEHLETLLTQGKVALFFDGLDEVAAEVRPRLYQAIQALKAAYGAAAHLIVTCRIRSYPTDEPGQALLPGFEVFTLAPFTPEQVKDFVTAWYQAARMPENQRADRIANLQRAATAPDLLRLARNPMLLTTMALIHQTNTELPRERVLLYAQAVDILILRWQKHRGLAISDRLRGVLEEKRKVRKILERLGYEAHLRLDPAAESADLTRKDVLAILEEPAYLGEAGLAAEFLNYADQRAGLLVGRGGDDATNRPQLYSFPHRTFLQYLAGCYLLRGRRGELIANFKDKLPLGGDWYVTVQLGVEELLFGRQNEADFLDLAYALCPERESADETAWRGCVWSGYMAMQMGKGEIARDEVGNGQAYLARLRPRLLAVMERSPLPALERVEAGQHLARLGDTRPGVLDARQMEMCYVPGGPFYMGDGDEQHLNEELARGYWMGRFPVTNAQFRQFVAAGGYATAAFWPEAQRAGRWRAPGEVRSWQGDWRIGPYAYGEPFDLDNYPVVGVTWYEARAFTRWLNTLIALPAGWSAYLPSEAEWEKAARGGARVPQTTQRRTLVGLGAEVEPRPAEQPNDRPKRRFPWGDTFNANAANGQETRVGSTSAVGCFPLGVSPYGCEEMSGNVYEWTRSPWKNYPYKREDGRERAPQNDTDRRAIRGGAYWDEAEALRCAYRDWNRPNYDDYDLGFRLVVSRAPAETGKV